MAGIPGFDIRYTNLYDTDHLREWLMTPGILDWFPMSDEKEVEDAIRVWIGFSRFSSSITAIIEGKPCGIGTLFLMPYRKIRHHCFFKLIVDPKLVRKGIGTSLLKNLKHLAKNYFHLELMHTELFEGNPFIGLLKKFDFHQFARQEKYVKEKDGTYKARILMESYLK
ncbi:MAG: GNAT family N-acetyltransferase [Chlamydiae bacterium]|nr:GNAT family N-acetyltransferase [Chlamydiota bacterium]